MKRFNVLFLVIVLGGSVRPILAHHSLAAEFDLHKQVTLAGVVTKVEWTNPHAWVYLDVKDPKTGTVANWASQLNSPNALLALGWNRDTVRVGEMLTVFGFLSRDGSHKVNTIEIKWPDGRTTHAQSAHSTR